MCALKTDQVGSSSGSRGVVPATSGPPGIRSLGLPLFAPLCMDSAPWALAAAIGYAAYKIGGWTSSPSLAERPIEEVTPLHCRCAVDVDTSSAVEEGLAAVFLAAAVAFSLGCCLGGLLVYSFRQPQSPQVHGGKARLALSGLRG